MRTISSKALALSMIIVTAIGMLFSLVFIIQIWRYRKPVTVDLQAGINRTSALLKTTSQGLDVIDLAVKNVYTSTVFIDQSASTLGETISSTNQFANSASNFIGNNLINTITNTQSAINSAQSSAVVVDNILTGLSKIPLIGLKYNPTKPLSVALGDVSRSLDPLQSSLQGFQTDLESTQTNMQAFQIELKNLNQNVESIKTNLESTQSVIDSYRIQLTSMQSSVDKAQISIARWITNLAWILTFIFLWSILIQIGIMLQAIDTFLGDRRTVIVDRTE